LAEPRHNLGAGAVVECQEQVDETHCRKAAEASACLDEQCVGSPARRRHCSSDASRPSANNENVGRADYRQLTSRLLIRGTSIHSHGSIVVRLDARGLVPRLGSLRIAPKGFDTDLQVTERPDIEFWS
jgi:hypothetical protein